ncbi:hypothetical protein KSD_31420 [Ktedonobacter sp. SOSP1-85]|uniref:hypothetical protein n=1 Tax=Ktedonobacter sp. SOSP1-85 TaxID=2778367 RepID=UPI001915867D|nr:hypothetical protein [Ktedonobacter sp. SOSP1-85]GHO75371.1 hypothetical protein KSD_31420 [Ktedonobacter sp. SOSP1-85]
MSTDWLDYIPFDYNRYVQEILPAFEQAFLGDSRPLETLLQKATNFAFTPRYTCPIPLTGEDVETLLKPHRNFQGLFDAKTLRSLKEGTPCDIWQHMAQIIPSLEGKTMRTLGKYGNLLHSHVFSTFCCELPPPLIKITGIWGGYPFIWNEGVHLWEEYCERDEETRTLWSAFYQLPPPELAQKLPLIATTDKYYNQDTPRNFPSTVNQNISSFITYEETENLLHLRTRDTPLLESIVSCCVRDGRSKDWSIDITRIDPQMVKHIETVFPWQPNGEKFHMEERALFDYWMQEHNEEMQGFIQRYHENLWRIEDELLHRVRFAVERGWGLLKLRG